MLPFFYSIACDSCDICVWSNLKVTVNKLQLEQITRCRFLTLFIKGSATAISIFIRIHKTSNSSFTHALMSLKYATWKFNSINAAKAILVLEYFNSLHLRMPVPTL